MHALICMKYHDMDQEYIMENSENFHVKEDNLNFCDLSSLSVYK